MVQGVEQLGCMLLCGLSAWAQQEAPKITVNVEGFRYPPIARAARIQGDVLFEVSSAEPRLISSAHPILVEAARRNLETWKLPPLDGGSYHVGYHFSISGRPGTKPETVLIGDPFDRFVLRLFHAPTTKVVQVCDNVAPGATRVGPVEDDVIDVFTTAPEGCFYAP